LLAAAADAAAVAVVVGVAAAVAAAADAPVEDIPPPHDPHLSLPLGRQVEAKRLLDLLRVAQRRSPGRAQPHNLEPAPPDSPGRAPPRSLARDQRVELRVQAPRRDNVQLRVPVLRIALPEAVQRPGS
jgi:hypothetical protein